MPLPRTIGKGRVLLGGGGVNPLVNYLSSLVLAETAGGIYWPFDDTGAFSRAINPALALGRNIVINGTFATDTIWAKGTNATIAGGVGVFTGVLVNVGFSQTITGWVIGKSYEITFNVSGYSSGSVRFVAGGTNGTLRSANGTYTETVTLTTNASLQIIAGATSTLNVDNVTVKQVNILASSVYPSAELLADGSMEAVGVGAWTAVAGAALTKETASPHGGIQSLRVARNGTNNPIARQTILTIGKTYRIRGWFASDGVTTPEITGFTANISGTTSTSWQAFDSVQLATATSFSFRATNATVDGQYAQLDDVSVTEVNPLTGVISGATVNQDAGARLLKAYSFDGVNDYVNVYSADLNSVLNPDAGTLIVFMQVAAGVWADGISRVAVRFTLQNNTDLVDIIKSSAANTLQFRYIGASITKSVTSTAIGGSVGWNMLAITWDKVSDQMKANINGVQVGSTQTGLGAMTGNLSTTLGAIGASTTAGANPYNGLITHPFLANRAFTDAELLDIARRAGVAA